MKISNSKKQLAEIIHENGGWREGANFSAQDKDGEVFHYIGKPTLRPGRAVWDHRSCIGHGQFYCKKLPDWHQTILSREEYFHLYQAPDADGWIEWRGGESPVARGTMLDLRHRDGELTVGVSAGVMRNFGERDASSSYWVNDNYEGDIIAYRLHKPEQEKPEPAQAEEAKPTIEQLAADYRNAKDFAEHKQKEADDAKGDAEVKLAEMVAAGKAIGLVLSVEHEVSVITPALPPIIPGDLMSWHRWEVGDFISWSIVGHSGEFRIISVHHDPSRNIGDFEVEDKQGGVYRVYGNECRFIRRP